jgi:hypothetical protein
MQKNKNESGERNERPIAGDYDYEVSCLASRHNLNLQEARDLMALFENSPEKLRHAAKKFIT